MILQRGTTNHTINISGLFSDICVHTHISDWPLWHEFDDEAEDPLLRGKTDGFLCGVWSREVGHIPIPNDYVYVEKSAPSHW